MITDTESPNIQDTKNIRLLLNNQNTLSQNEDIKEIKLYLLLVSILLTIIESSFIICDIYFGLNDESCVNQHVDRINITLKTFLLVRGFLILALISGLIISYFVINEHNLETYMIIMSTKIILISIFLFAWNIVGAVLFWDYMDRSKCDNSVYNYTYASLIIVFLSVLSSILSRKNND